VKCEHPGEGGLGFGGAVDTDEHVQVAPSRSTGTQDVRRRPALGPDVQGGHHRGGRAEHDAEADPGVEVPSTANHHGGGGKPGHHPHREDGGEKSNRHEPDPPM
jgi:hypothetical protein